MFQWHNGSSQAVCPCRSGIVQSSNPENHHQMARRALCHSGGSTFPSGGLRTRDWTIYCRVSERRLQSDQRYQLARRQSKSRIKDRLFKNIFTGGANWHWTGWTYLSLSITTRGEEIEFSPTWSCVSLTRSTTSSDWKLIWCPNHQKRKDKLLWPL